VRINNGIDFSLRCLGETPSITSSVRPRQGIDSPVVTSRLDWSDFIDFNTGHGLICWAQDRFAV
jgi:hypothetical protein